MKSNELRVGNWVYSHPTQSEVQFWEGNFSQRLNTTEGDKSIFELIEPIPLTEEWLKRFGFGVLPPNLFYLKSFPHFGIGLYLERFNVILRQDGKNKEGKRTTKFFQAYDDLKYVHQLQNLFFALTGSELELQQQNP